MEMNLINIRGLADGNEFQTLFGFHIKISHCTFSQKKNAQATCGSDKFRNQTNFFKRRKNFEIAMFIKNFQEGILVAISDIIRITG